MRKNNPVQKKGEEGERVREREREGRGEEKGGKKVKR